MNHINSDFLPKLGCVPPPKISESTVIRWLKGLGLKYRKVRKAISMYGHECDDIVSYRKVYVEKMAIFNSQMPHFCGDKLINITWPEGQPLILVIQVGSTFAAFDGQRRL